ncbi:MAG: DMT family transporter [Acidobacteriota bacterium]
MTPAPKENITGILYMVAAVAVLAVMDAVMKVLGSRYPAFQVACLRGLMSIPFVLLWVYVRDRSLTTLVRVRWRFHLFRGALAILMLSCFIFGLRSLPLSEAYALFFVAPLLVTALSALLLGETVGWRRWVAVSAGFGGVLIVLRPGVVEFNWGAVAVLFGAACYAFNAITVRVLGRTDSTAGMTFWFTSLLGLGAGVLAFPGWTPLLGGDFGWLLALGLTGSVGQYLLTESFRRAEVSVVAPFEYSALFWALLLDLVVFGVLPGAAVWIGAGVIIASGLYLVRRERSPQPMTPP